MSYRVRYTKAAREDHLRLFAFLLERGLQAAARMDALFSGAAARLADYPTRGRFEVISGTRELIPHESQARRDEAQCPR